MSSMTTTQSVYVNAYYFNTDFLRAPLIYVANAEREIALMNLIRKIVASMLSHVHYGGLYTGSVRVDFTAAYLRSYKSPA